ncbi:hypothetical protein ACGFZS_09735 [Streptomyces sp. NPDC048288]|uniref:hypothetical protein n=1 Tax=Streptomyces sp. NPDC048288 TaxID=3365529 RepID=UPI003714B85A
MTVRLSILGDDGEWHEVPGITTVELHQEEPETLPDDAYWRRHDALDALHFAMTAHADARRSKVIDQDGNPVRPRQDRPAWQSPYGPPPRRR